MLGSRLPKSRKFTYKPIYYNPDEDERKKRKIQFARKTTRAAAKKRSLVHLLVLLGMILYLLFFLSRMGKS